MKRTFTITDGGLIYSALMKHQTYSSVFKSMIDIINKSDPKDQISIPLYKGMKVAKPAPTDTLLSIGKTIMNSEPTFEREINVWLSENITDPKYLRDSIKTK